MIRIAAALAFVWMIGVAHAAQYGKLLAQQSRITFTSKQMGVPIEGNFGKFNADVSFDPQKPEAGRATIEVDLASADAGSKDANEELMSKGWFNVKQFPVATFASDGPVRVLGASRYEARGTLNIKGRTREVVVPFTHKVDGANAVLEGTILLLRTQYGVGEGAWGDTSVVADEVPIRFRLVLAPK